MLQAFGGPGRTAAGFVPSYSMHPIIAGGTRTEWLPTPRRSDFTIDIPAAAALLADRAPDVTFLTSPNNPTGQSLEPDELAHLVDAAPGIVVVDEAYAEFSDRPSAVVLLPTHGRKLIVSRTMSKAFAFAGGRLGYLAAAPAVVDALQLVRLPYHLSSLTQAAARASLRHADATLGSVALLRSERERVVAALVDQGWSLPDTQANFVWFGTGDRTADFAATCEDAGLVVRPYGTDGVRVSIGEVEANDRLVEVAGRWLAGEAPS